MNRLKIKFCDYYPVSYRFTEGVMQIKIGYPDGCCHFCFPIYSKMIQEQGTEITFGVGDGKEETMSFCPVCGKYFYEKGVL